MSILLQVFLIKLWQVVWQVGDRPRQIQVIRSHRKSLQSAVLSLL